MARYIYCSLTLHIHKIKYTISSVVYLYCHPVVTRRTQVKFLRATVRVFPSRILVSTYLDRYGVIPCSISRIKSQAFKLEA
jgi:hypothetical protein